MKNYKEPVFDVVMTSAQDVLTTSPDFLTPGGVGLDNIGGISDIVINI